MNETTPPEGAPTPASGASPNANQNSAPNGAPNGTPHGTATGAPNSDRFFAWLRSLGIVRGNDRWFAGVAGGIAAKAGIDPLIVRGIFVVLAFLGGPGILLYLAGWLLLPDASGRIHVEEIFRGRASAGVITWTVILGALIVIPVLIGILGGFSGGIWGWSAFSIFPNWAQVSLAVVWWALIVPAGIVMLIVWLTQRRPGAAPMGSAAQGPAQGTPAPGAPASSAATSAGAGAYSNSHAASFTSGNTPGTTEATRSTFTAQPGAQQFTQSSPQSQAAQPNDWAAQTAAWGEKVGQDAQAWGERVGREASDRAAAQGREAAERARALHESRRLGAGHVVLTLAIALLAAPAAAIWALTSDTLGPSAIPGDDSSAILVAIIAALGIFAISLIVVGIRGRNSGWVGFLAFCGIVALIFTAILPWGSRVQPFGTTEVHITGVDDPAGVTVLAGNAVIDLENLETRHDFTVWVVAGNATIELPDDQPVIVEIVVGAGNIRDSRTGEATRTQSGPFLGSTVGANLDDARQSEISHITVRVIAGNVNINGADTDANLDRVTTNRGSSSLGSLAPVIPIPHDSIILEKAA